MSLIQRSTPMKAKSDRIVSNLMMIIIIMDMVIKSKSELFSDTPFLFSAYVYINV